MLGSEKLARLQSLQSNIILVFVLIFALGSAFIAKISNDPMAYNFGLFIASLIVLLKGADLLVEGSSKIAEHLGISSLIIGMTVVAMGTSLPETAVTVYSNFIGSTGISLGNIIGSNIFNVAVVIGIAAIGFPLAANKPSIWFNSKYMLFASFLLLALSFNTFADPTSNPYVLGTYDGIILFAFFIFFLLVAVGSANREHLEFMKHQLKKEVKTENEKTQHNVFNLLILVFVGIIGIAVGGQFMVDSSVGMAEIFGIPQVIIGLTIIAIGTSLPELATSLVSMFKKKQEIALGNIIGSNIFNILFVMGIAAILKPVVDIAYSTIWSDMLVMIGLSLLLFAFMRRDRIVRRSEGVILFAIYIVYMIYLLNTIIHF